MNTESNKYLLPWSRISRTKRAQYQVSHLSERTGMKSVHLTGDDGVMGLSLDVIANEDCVILAYFFYGKTAIDDFFFEFVHEASSIEEGKKIAEEVYKLTRFNTSIRYLVNELGFELQV